jgi:hypothetical protein
MNRTRKTERCASCKTLVKTRRQFLTEPCPKVKQTRKTWTGHLISARVAGSLKEEVAP